LKEGDRVYVDPFMWCRTCHFCKKGKSRRRLPSRRHHLML
jgi:threonine dehydrogenase-like Zn-dependent dehydrogenase